MRKGIKHSFTNEGSLFRAYVKLLEPIFRISNREADVFAHLLYLNNKKKDIDSEDRFSIIFSTKSRKQMIEDLDINPGVFENCLTELRKKSLIVNNTIPEYYQNFVEDNKLEILINLTLKNEE